MVLENALRPGGLCRTEWYDGFDHSIHIPYSQDPYATCLIRDELLPDSPIELARRSYCCTAGVYTEYPYQQYNFGLPPEIIEENILGVIEARRNDAGFPPADFEQ
jgi:hypothetical protein